jgi:hyaluronoglucosaminidase
MNPGRDIKWNAADSNAVLSKFESMYTLGVRCFALFFDDMPGKDKFRKTSRIIKLH